MSETRQKYRAVMREDHPAAGVVAAFVAMRDGCRHYRGIKVSDTSLQCRHADADRESNWCAMDCCPLLRERASAEAVGWR